MNMLFALGNTESSNPWKYDDVFPFMSGFHYFLATVWVLASVYISLISFGKILPKLFYCFCWHCKLFLLLVLEAEPHCTAHAVLEVTV